MSWQDLHAGREMDGWVAREVLRRSSVELYSTDIRKAWVVLERLIEIRGPEATVVVGYDSMNERWFCRDDQGDGVDGIESIGETAPLAICRAALRAIDLYKGLHQ